MAALLLLVTAAAAASLGDISRRDTGDLFTLQGEECGAAQCAEHGAGANSNANGVAKTDCACVCPQRAPLFREDRELCVDDLPECSLATFGTDGVQRIPFVYLPLKGQIIHPSREITFLNVKTPICAVSGAQYLTKKGFVDLRNTVDADVPFSLFRDEGRTFLQWTGEDEMRTRMTGRVMVVRLLCRDVATMPSSPLDLRGVFTPCVAFRVQGAPPKYANNITEVQFAPNAQISESSSSTGLSIAEYITIGISSLVLGIVYVASVFLYLHVKKRRKAANKEAGLRRLKVLKTKTGLPITENDIIRINNERAVIPNTINQDNGVIKKNPLLNVGRLFHETDNFSHYSHSDDVDSGPHSQLFNTQTTSALIHQRNDEIRKCDNMEVNHRDEPNIERLPDEHVSIVETIDDREIARPVGTTRRKLYFNPSYFEPHLMADPPAAALEFLSKIREVISIAKQKMAAKRFQPVLNEIPEEETYPSKDNSLDLYSRLGSQRSESIVSLKRENSRKRSVTCLGCPGCQSQSNGEIQKILQYKPTPCISCQNAKGDKQHSIRKWLENIPNGKQPLFLSENLITNQSNLASSLLSLPLTINQSNMKENTNDQLQSLSLSDDFIIPRTTRSHSVRSAPSSRRYSLPLPEFNCSNCPNDVKNYRTISRVNDITSVPNHDKHRGGSLRYNFESSNRIRKSLVQNKNVLPDMVNEAMALDKFSKLEYNPSSSDEEKVPIHILKKPSENLYTRILNGSPPGNDYETDSLERSATNKTKDVLSSDFNDIPSSQASPSLSSALPLAEELSIRNDIYKPNSNGTSNTPSPEADLCIEQNHYETIDVSKIRKVSQHKIDPTIIGRNTEYNFVSEVYVNNYNFGSTPTSPSGSECSMGSRKLGNITNIKEKPGCLTIEVKDSPENYIKIHESDDFEPDTLDRKHPKHKKIIDRIPIHNNDIENSNQSTYFRRVAPCSRDAKRTQEFDSVTDDEEHYKSVSDIPKSLYSTCVTSRSLDYIHNDAWEDPGVWNSEEGRILTLELRHSKRQRQCTPPEIKQMKILARPDILPPLPPTDDIPIYEKPSNPPRRVHSEDELKDQNLPGFSYKSLSPPPYALIESDNNLNSGRSVNSPLRSFTKSVNSDYEEIMPIDPCQSLIILNKNENGYSSVDKLSENDCCGNSINTRTFVKESKQNNSRNKQRRKKLNIDDSGYLSSDSTNSKPINSKTVKKNLLIGKVVSCSDSDDTENEARSESGAESVETHSVYFGSFRNIETKNDNTKQVKTVNVKRNIKQ